MSTHAERFDVVIGGGSFAGMALALALARAAPGQIAVAVVDRTPPGEAASRAHDGRASALTAASRRLLDSVGVWGDIADSAQEIAGIDITDSRLGAAVRPPLLHFDGGLGQDGVAAHMVENHLLRAALMETARANPDVTLIAPDALADFEAAPGGQSVRLESGRRLAAPLLVAADGRKSALRRAAGIRTVGWSYPQTGIVATVAHEKPHGGRAVQHFLPAGPFAILPLTGDRASIVWTEGRGEAARIMALDDAGFLAELKTRFGATLGALSLAGPRAAHPLDMHIARRFVAERIALIGDAAHGVHPLAGQGLNIGLRDVAALAEVVVEGMRLGMDPGETSLLTRYERWRRFDSAFSGLAMDGLNRLFSSDNAPLRAVRSLGLGLVERAPALKRFFVHEAAGLTGDVPRLLKGEAI